MFQFLREIKKKDSLNRNDLCWCGRGNKYKKCHMNYDERID